MADRADTKAVDRAETKVDGSLPTQDRADTKAVDHIETKAEATKTQATKLGNNRPTEADIDKLI
ncbi:MAG: hypothetical protein KGL39_20985, partial [Patescibacteria group bacterium]|nr:hypothetical protein [Patescibacteria group bacterium]